MQVDFTQAVALLQKGAVVAIPTETVYGLAADASNDDALRQVYAIKQRPADHPLIVHIASQQDVVLWASEFPPLARAFADAFWPGPFTLVLPARSQVSSVVRGQQATIALRVPSHPLTLRLLQQSGLALAAPSANKFTQLSPTTAHHVTAGLGPHVAVLDGGACQVGIESTIVSVHGDDWRLLRLGMVSKAALQAVAGRPPLEHQVHQIKVPGQHLLHYSPRTPLHLFATRDALFAFAQAHQQSATLLIGAGDPIASTPLFNLADNPDQAAEQLYDVLHQMDALGRSHLLVEMPPNRPEWLAIHDRLNRAAHGQ